VAAAELVRDSGAVLATDISPYMLDRARERLALFPTASLSVEDGQALSFPVQSFDAVICNMGLMYFPEPNKGIAEFYRVLRLNGRAAVSVFIGSGAMYRLSSGREFKAVSQMIAARKTGSVHGGHFLRLAECIADLFADAGFRQIETEAYSGLLIMPSLDVYVRSIEAGAGSAGAEFLSVAPEIREAVRAELYELLEGVKRRGGASDCARHVCLRHTLMCLAGQRPQKPIAKSEVIRRGGEIRDYLGKSGLEETRIHTVPPQL
jgi:SAM-dependent methyltransferase